MITINILLALSATAYWYVTDNLWLAGLGVLASVLIVDKLWFVVIALVAVIGYSCVYYLWSELPHYLQLENLDILTVTVSYMVVAFVRGVLAFRG